MQPNAPLAIQDKKGRCPAETMDDSCSFSFGYRTWLVCHSRPATTAGPATARRDQSEPGGRDDAARRRDARWYDGPGHDAGARRDDGRGNDGRWDGLSPENRSILCIRGEDLAVLPGIVPNAAFLRVFRSAATNCACTAVRWAAASGGHRQSERSVRRAGGKMMVWCADKHGLLSGSAENAAGNRA